MLVGSGHFARLAVLVNVLATLAPTMESVLMGGAGTSASVSGPDSMGEYAKLVSMLLLHFGGIHVLYL